MNLDQKKNYFSQNESKIAANARKMKESERTPEYTDQFKHTTSSCFHSSPVQHVSSFSIHKAVMACIRFIKCLFLFIILFILSLLCLCFMTISAKDQVFQELLKRLNEDVDKYKEDRVYRRAEIPKILDLASSLDNEEKLQILKETLQTAIEKEERLKEVSKYIMTIMSKRYDEEMKKLEPQMKEAMISLYYFPPLQEIVDFAFHMFKKFGPYIDKKLDLLQA